LGYVILSLQDHLFKTLLGEVRFPKGKLWLFVLVVFRIHTALIYSF
jgi:hypothetical protein